VLIVALGAGTVQAVKAFPLYGEGRAPKQEPQPPPRDPQRPPRAQQYTGHRIDLDFVDADLRAVLRVFAKEGNLNMTIDPRVEGRVNALFHDVPWDEALDRILRSHKLGSTIDGSTRYIAPLAVNRPPPPPPPAPVSREIPPPPPPPPSPPAGAVEFQALVDQYKAVRISESLKGPTLTRHVNAVYPPVALAARVQGVITLEVLVDAGGQVVDARVLQSIPLLDQAALDSVMQWEFMPTLLNGVPQAVVVTATVSFSLR
jgi:TonB family protein